MYIYHFLWYNANMTKLSKIFDKEISKPRRSEGKKPPAFKPSALGTPCMRKLYYSYNRVEEDRGLPLNVIRICRLGDAVHDMLNDIFKRAGVLIEDELRLVDPELEVSAYVDAMMEIDGELWLGEYKSINSNGFNKLNGPKPEHMYQGVSYLYIFNKLLKDGKFPEYQKYGAPKGIKFIYVNKNNSEMKEFDVTENDAIFKSILFKMDIVKSHTRDGLLPQKSYDWCNSCPWQKKCDKDYVHSTDNGIE